MAVLNPKLALGTPLRLASLLLLATFFACSGVQKHDGGYIFIPEPEGDAVEQDVESLLRAETGVWLGMPRGVAEDVLLERHGLSSGRQPSSGGVETLVAPGGGYVYLLYYDGPPGSAKILVCGLQRLSAAARVSAAGPGEHRRPELSAYRPTGGLGVRPRDPLPRPRTLCAARSRASAPQAGGTGTLARRASAPGYRLACFGANIPVPSS
jgi:hypothetical protein